ncbi:MAG: hypothetical protein WCH44_02360 [Betaproteobacteria bacterium]
MAAPQRAPCGARTRQRGMMLIEALMAVLIFLLGIVGMVGVSALAVTSQSDAQYRTDANKFATQILNQIWVSVNRLGSAADMTTSLNSFKHQENGADCNFAAAEGAAATDPAVALWVAAVRAGGTGLPGADATMQQIVVAGNVVTVTVCWKAPGDLVARRHVMMSMVN